MTIEFETDDGYTVIGEASTSWSFVGAGLRLSAELLGPEYSMSWNTLDSGLKLFFSRAVQGKAGEDLVEKQNAEMGLMPVVAERGGGLRLRGRGSPLRARLPRQGKAEAHVRRRPRGREDPDDGVSERGGAEDARVSAARAGQVRPGGRSGHLAPLGRPEVASQSH